MQQSLSSSLAYNALNMLFSFEPPFFIFTITWSCRIIPRSLLTVHLILTLPFVGVSLKTQELYAIVFVTRYLDLFTDYISFYNTLMKIIFLGSSISIVWYMKHHKVVRRSYNKDQDTFRHYVLMLPCLFLALIVNERFSFKEVSQLL